MKVTLGTAGLSLQVRQFLSIFVTAPGAIQFSGRGSRPSNLAGVRAGKIRSIVVAKASDSDWTNSNPAGS